MQKESNITTAGDTGFAADEMMPCGACQRLCPPNRTHCLYCGAPIDVSKRDLSKLKISIRPLENWELGFNVVVVSTNARGLSDEDVDDLERDTGIGSDAIRQAMAETSPIPVARVDDALTAEILAARFQRFGVPTEIIADDALCADQRPTRCRSMSCGESLLTFQSFDGGASIEAGRDSVEMLVVGSVYEAKTETAKKLKRGARVATIESESTDETRLLDIYLRDLARPLRVSSVGFDFSCLGPKMQLTASQNFSELLAKLTSCCPDASVVADYTRVRRLLDLVWQPDYVREGRIAKNSIFGRAVLKDVSTINNLSQFNKYSRLRRTLSK